MDSSQFNLEATTQFSGFSREWPRLTIRERAGYELCSLTARNGVTDVFLSRFREQFGIEPPAPGKTINSSKEAIFWMSPRQWFIEQPSESSLDMDMQLTKLFGDSASITLQSDGWAQLELSGSDSPALFERLCALDLSLSAFPAGCVARTSMHHINALVMHPSDVRGQYRLYCPRSFASSFLDMICNIANNVYALKI